MKKGDKFFVIGHDSVEEYRAARVTRHKVQTTTGKWFFQRQTYTKRPAVLNQQELATWRRLLTLRTFVHELEQAVDDWARNPNKSTEAVHGRYKDLLCEINKLSVESPK